jgi:Signal peptidase, peptidase S26
VEGDRRAGKDTRGGSTGLSEARRPSGLPDPVVRGPSHGWRGPWRLAVSEGSMLPTIAPGDWLVVNPLIRRWPARGTIVVFHEPLAGGLAIKRVTAGPGDRVPFAGGFLELAEDEAWLTSDADEKTAAGAGFGPPVDSSRYGPVSVEHLVGRVVLRYGPARRFGRIPRRKES